MIRIEITEPHLLDNVTLEKTAAYLLSFAQYAGDALPQEIADKQTEFLTRPLDESCGKPLEADIKSTETEISEPTEGYETIPAIELDHDRLPWDARIHARTKTKTADGRWKLMRGVGKTKVESINQELEQAALSPPPLPPQVVCNLDFPQLMEKIMEVVTSKKMNHQQILDIAKSFGLPSIPVIPTRPDLIPAIGAAIDNFILGCDSMNSIIGAGL